MAVCFALALDVTMDDLLGPATGPKNGRKPSRKVLRRLERIEGLPAHQQSALLKSIDLMLTGVIPYGQKLVAPKPLTSAGRGLRFRRMIDHRLSNRDGHEVGSGK
jgi:hypothetical protein